MGKQYIKINKCLHQNIKAVTKEQKKKIQVNC